MAPTTGGDEFASEGSAWTGSFACLACIECAIVTSLFGLVHRIFGSIHFGGVLFIAEGGGDWIGFLELYRRRLGKSLTTKNGRKCGGNGDFA